MIQNSYISKNSNCRCSVCAKHAENLMPSPQQKLKTSAEVSDNEHEEENSKIILVVIKKILIINVRHKIYLSQMLSN